MEPKAGLEPATTRLWSDNPILRPVEIAGASFKQLEYLSIPEISAPN